MPVAQVPWHAPGLEGLSGDHGTDVVAEEQRPGPSHGYRAEADVEWGVASDANPFIIVVEGLPGAKQTRFEDPVEREGADKAW